MTATDHPLLRPWRALTEDEELRGREAIERSNRKLWDAGQWASANDVDGETFHEECGFRFDLHDNREPGRRLPFGCPTETTARLRWGR